MRNIARDKKLLTEINQNTHDYFKALSLVFKSNPWQCICLLISILIQGSLSSVTIWLSAKVITEISQMKSYDQKTMIYLCVAWCLSLLIANFIEPWILYWQSNLSDYAVHKINKDIIEKSNSIKRLDYFENEEFYNDIQILQSQASNKPINLVVTTVGLARDVVIITTLLFLLYSVVPWISFIVLAGAFINFKTFSILQVKTWQESLGRSMDSRKMSYLSATSINARFAKEIRFFNLGSYIIKEYVEGFRNFHSRMKKVRLKQAIWPIFPIVLTACGNLLAFFVIVNSAMNGKISVGDVILFLQSLSQLHLTVTNFGEQAGWLKGHILFFNKYFNFMKMKEPSGTIPKSKLISIDETNKFHIEFKNVYFAYKDDNYILKNINFTIKPGEKIAFVGANGAGKSSLIKLLCGLYLPSAGQILINGIPSESIDLDQWRHKIAPLFQDFNSYSFSLQRNIAMGASVDEPVLSRVSLSSGVNEFAEKLPAGMEELLGREFGGAELSQGQWQKVALARALFKDSPIYIMDEPTSFLDPLSEHDIFTRFMSATKHKTVIFITHRLSLSMMANKIILLDHGNILQTGSHKELLFDNKLYKEMFESQANNYLLPDEIIT
jgi:ATP-binding cassette, subfamily B, bacterial